MTADNTSAGIKKIPSVPRDARRFPWTREEDALLGKFYDREVAEKSNRTIHAVRDRRQFLGIPALGGAPQDHRIREEDFLAMRSDAEVRARFGWSAARVRLKRQQLFPAQEQLRHREGSELTLLRYAAVPGAASTLTVNGPPIPAHAPSDPRFIATLFPDWQVTPLLEGIRKTVDFYRNRPATAPAPIPR